MDIQSLVTKLTERLGKYKYALLILLLGVGLMLIPTVKAEQKTVTHAETTPPVVSDEERLANILSAIKGAGQVEVLLRMGSGEQTVYQTDTDSTGNRSDTVTVTDANRNETGLVTQVLPPVYQGAIIVCQGAGDPSVRLAIVDAVTKYTGLGANQVSVLEMK